VLLFPVFDTTNLAAQTFHIIGWSAFLIDVGGVIQWKQENSSCTPNCKVLQGHFVTYIATGITAGSGSGGTNFGVRAISLTQ
jgi:hypothetical protein